jgi:hypothetical protein
VSLGLCALNIIALVINIVIVGFSINRLLLEGGSFSSKHNCYPYCP